MYVRSIAALFFGKRPPLSSKTWPTLCWLADGNVCSSRRWGQVRPSCAVKPAVADRIVVVEGPARGDGIQAEAGLLELADIVLVNKADLDGAERHAGELRESFALDREDAPEVMLTSGLKNIGVEEAAAELLELEVPVERSVRG